MDDEHAKEQPKEHPKEQPKEHLKDRKKDKEGTKSTTELDKYWQVVLDNPSDFAGWTYLLHYVEQENNIEAARKAFGAFFARYPYCYGYWKKFADMERILNSAEAAEKVFEDGVQAIPLSVDLWIHYLNFYKILHKDNEDYYDKVKLLFKRALESAGQEFRSDRLWDMCVTWEEENSKFKEVTKAYDALITIPTQLYSHHFEKFRKHVKSHLPRDILSTDEFLTLRQQVLSEIKKNSDPIDDDEDDKVSGDKETEEALPPGVDSTDIDGPPGFKGPTRLDKDMMSDEELELMKKKIIESRKPLHEKNETEVGKRWSFEEGIKRPYFHVKALERAQLKNWKEYLDFEIEHGSHERTIILFERCLIACALYEDMWIKYAKYMEEKDFDSAGDIYRRACVIHLPKKPHIHFAWAAYEEKKGDVDKAAEILSDLQKNIPDVLEVMTRQINVERRRKNDDKVEELYKKYTSEMKNKMMASFFSAKFARYLYKVKQEHSKAKEIIKEALLKDPTSPKLYMQLVDIGFQSNPIDIEAVGEAFDMALASDMTENQKIIFSQRKLEFMEDFGDILSNQNAYEEHVKRMKMYHLSSRKRTHDESTETDKEPKKSKGDVNGYVPPVVTTSTPTPTSQTTPTPTATTTTASQDTSYQYHQSPWVRYQQNSYNYHQSWPPYSSSYYTNH